jgi:hypothetical protein
MGKLRQRFVFVAAVLLAASLQSWSQPIAYVSNLDDRWPADQGIGDIHGIFGDPIVARFTTGNTGVQLDAVTLEFLTDKSLTGWEKVDVNLHSSGVGGTGRTLINPSINPKPTQWPQNPRNNNLFTVYVDFHPPTATYLPPLTPFEVVIDAPIGAQQNGLLYTASSGFQATDGWTMGPTSGTHDPSAAGEFLKLAVYATAVPEPSALTILFGGLGLLLFGRIALR